MLPCRALQGNNQNLCRRGIWCGNGQHASTVRDFRSSEWHRCRQAGVNLDRRLLICQQASAEGESADIESEYEQSRRQIEELQAALKAVDSAILDAEANLDEVTSLPSSDLKNVPSPRQASPLNANLKLGALALVGVLALYISQGSTWPIRVAVGIIAGAGIGLYGYQKGSLSKSGGYGAALLGACTWASSFRATAVLLTFFFTSSKLTTYCQDRKLDDEEAKEGGQRNWLQVACNGAMPSLFLLAAAWISGGLDAPLRCAAQDVQTRRYIALTGAYLGYYSCCCGDTWASEVGQLSKDTPRLITSLRPVRKGTNGGVTKLGLLASVSGGLCMGITFYLGSLLTPDCARFSSIQEQAKKQLMVIPLGVLGGLVGSMIDSVLGATIQFTGFNRKTQKLTSKTSDDVTAISGLPILSNNGVNFVSATLTAAFSAILSLVVLSPVV